MIGSTWTTWVNCYTSIPQYVILYFHMQRFKFFDFMVIEVRFFKKKMKNMDETCKSVHLISQYNQFLYTDY